MASTFIIRHIQNPSEEDIAIATKVIHEAFEYFLAALGREDLVEPFVLAHVKSAAYEGQVHLAELPDVGVVGAALWFAPGQAFLSTDTQMNLGWNQIMSVLSDEQRKWWADFLKLTQDLPNALYGPGQQRASYHLQLIGVLPEYQKRGCASALFKHVEDIAKRDGRDVVLETLGESAVPVYKKMGFTVLGPEVVETGNGPANGYCFRKSF